MLKPGFTEMLRGMGPDFAGLAAELDNGTPQVSVRLNMAKGGAALLGEPDGILAAADGSVAWCPEGRYLAERPAFTLDPALHQGRYYVQEASSMCLAFIIRRLAGELGGGPLRLLDACAAPGGKTLCAADALPPRSLVVANEFDYRRADILRENVIKWGAAPYAVVTRGDTVRFRKTRGMFDIICVDAPCSGEGMMRKDATACEQWSPELVSQCAARQREILENVWEALRPGGYLVYSTCTFNLEENERLVAQFAGDYGAEGIDTGLGAFPGVVGSQLPGVEAARFLPGKVRGEGLFVSVLRKSGSEAGQPLEPKAPRRGKASKGTGLTPQQLKEAAGWIDSPEMTVESYVTAKGDTEVAALPKEHAPFISAISPYLDIILKGCPLATVKGHSLIPHHALAMSGLLSPSAFTHVEVPRDTALHYLRAEAVTLPYDTPKGYTLLTHNSYPLGFVKNLGSRANNLYPAPWRILKSL